MSHRKQVAKDLEPSQQSVLAMHLESVLLELASAEIAKKMASSKLEQVELAGLRENSVKEQVR